MVSGEKTEISVEKNFRFFVLFTSKNVASGYTLCHLENCFFLLYVCFKGGLSGRITWKFLNALELFSP